MRKLQHFDQSAGGQHDFFLKWVSRTEEAQHGDAQLGPIRLGPAESFVRLGPIRLRPIRLGPIRLGPTGPFFNSSQKNLCDVFST